LLETKEGKLFFLCPVGVNDGWMIDQQIDFVLGSYIDATRDEILKQYGSMDAYLHRGLGLSDVEIKKLKDELLE
jgi:hypothetical protein